MGELSRADRKLLWGKAANRCSICKSVLSRPASGGDPEVVVGEEAHIVGERPGAARYRPLAAPEHDGYGNRILLCPNDHTEVDKQPGKWPEKALREVKEEHENLMLRRTAGPLHQSGIQWEDPGDVVLNPVISGSQLARMVGNALAHRFDYSELVGAEERFAADFFQVASDWGDIYGDIGPSGHADASEDLSERIKEALELGLVLFGDVIKMGVWVAGHRELWPVVVLWMRRAEHVAREQRADAAAEAAGEA